ncbi:MAG: ABC transporter permease, partial [Terriglobales bacterium]
MMFRRREFREELDFHIRQRAADLERAGQAPKEALRRARIELGSAEKYTEQAREEAGGAALASIAQDVRYGLRLLRKSPGFTATAVLLLALGIGANAAIFSMVDWVMLRPIPAVANPGELTYLVTTSASGGHTNGFSYDDYNRIRTATGGAFTNVAGVQPFQRDGLVVNGSATTFWASYASGNFFTMLGTRPALGRFFAFDPAHADAVPREMVLGYAFWLSRFAGRADVIGEQVMVNGRPAAIIGVAPRGFQGTTPFISTDAYLPLTPSTRAEGVMLFARR